MKFPRFFWLLSSCVLGLLGCSDSTQPETPSSTSPAQPTIPPLFESVSPTTSGIRFQNQLEEGLNTNILMYEYFYNGGGVAVGDVNGDGWEDVYFSANMSPNALYLNQGDWKFEEVSETSGTAGRPGPWQTGVTMVDINADQKLDIYLCYSGSLPAEKRKNQLLINLGNNEQGIPQFEDQAAAYGLDSDAFSNQGFFFDMDRDGDLDMLLLNHNPKSLPVLNEVTTAQVIQTDDPQQGLRLFRQDGGTFKDVTQQAGISGSALSYGLGLGISDINQDGWPDFYVSNDYTIPDYLYLNNQNGTFTDRLKEQIGHNSHFSMGNDLADINNDGLPDIFTLDMLPEDNRRQKLLMAPDNYPKFDLNVRSGFHYQYMRNMLQLNHGNGTFSEVGQQLGISNTDWSWSALLADYDNDGWKDLYITNGYFRDYTNLDFIKYMEEFVQKKGRLQREDVLEIINQMPASNVNNYLFANEGGQAFSNQTRAWGVEQPSNSNGAAYADLDKDGDLDLIVNNINQPAFLFRNQAREQDKGNYLQIELEGEGKNPDGIGAHLSLKTKAGLQVIEQFPSRGYLSSVSPKLHVGVGAVDTIEELTIRWQSGRTQHLQGVATNQLLTLKESEAKGRFRSPKPEGSVFQLTKSPIEYRMPERQVRDFDRQSLLLRESSKVGPVMAQGDVNGDGKADVLIGGAQGQPIQLFLGSSPGRFRPVDVPAFEADQAYSDAVLQLLDANGDGALDLYAGSGGYHNFAVEDPMLEDRLYLNDGEGGFLRAGKAIPPMRESTGCVAVGDINGDGAPDLFVGGRVVPGQYPEAPLSYVLLNQGDGTFKDATRKMGKDLKEVGMVTAAEWIDLNQDGQLELLLTGEWLPIMVFGQIDGEFKEQTPLYFDQPFYGWWNSMKLVDVNADGRLDLIAANVGKNAQFQPSVEQPMEMVYYDFDKNESIDPIFTYYIQGTAYPYLTRDELLGQLSGLRSRFVTYASYANQTLDRIIIPGELNRADRWQATHTESMLFLQEEDGSFTANALPWEAQSSPIHTISTLDFNQDGKVDLLLCGNDHHFKLRIGQMDANYGLLLQGDGQGGFTYIPQRKSGLRLTGDIRSVTTVGNIWLFGRNEASLVAYYLEENAL